MQFIRIKDLREDADKTQKELADELYMHREQYRRYETGQSPISLELAIKIAEYYNVNLEYIAGLTNRKDKNFSNEELKIIEIWNSLTEREKGQFEHLYKEIQEERDRKKKENAG